MASEKNGEDQLLACLMVSWDQDRMSNSQLLLFSSGEKIWEWDLMKENFRSSHFCDNVITNFLE